MFFSNPTPHHHHNYLLFNHHHLLHLSRHPHFLLCRCLTTTASVSFFGESSHTLASRHLPDQLLFSLPSLYYRQLNAFFVTLTLIIRSHIFNFSPLLGIFRKQQYEGFCVLVSIVPLGLFREDNALRETRGEGEIHLLQGSRANRWTDFVLCSFFSFSAISSTFLFCQLKHEGVERVNGRGGVCFSVTPFL